MPRYIQCCFAEHAQSILDIYNKIVLESTYNYDHRPMTLQDMEGWFARREQQGFPIVGALSDESVPRFMGFATYDYFRDFDGYRQTVEHSVYVHEDFRGQGLGRVLLQMLIDAATVQKIHVLVGVIDSANQGSIALHEQLGFVFCGTLRQAGFKFGQWLDVCFYQRILPGSDVPPADAAR